MEYLGFSESCTGWKWIVTFGNGYLSCSWVWKSSTGGSFLAVRFGQLWMVNVGLFPLNKSYPLKEALKPNSQWILSDTFWQAGKYPRETANINTVCVLPWASSLSPPLWYNYIVLTLSATVVQVAGVELVLLTVCELLSKMRLSLASKTSMW